MKASIAAVLVLCCASGAFAGCKVDRLADLPVTMVGLRPTVHTQINGADVRLLVDTGAFFSMLTPGKTLELGLKTHAAPQGLFVIGIGGSSVPSVATVKDLVLDHIPLHNADFLVTGNEIDHEVAGVIGRNILSYADSEYDFANGMIYLVRPERCGERPLVYWSTTKSYSTAPIEPSDGRIPGIVIPVTINGIRLRGLMDSGSPVSFLGAAAARRVGGVVEGAGTAMYGGGIGRRIIHQTSGPISSVKIGDEEVKNTRLTIIDTNVEAADLLIGMDFFLSHHVFVARSQGKVYFTYNGGPVFRPAPVPIEGSSALSAPSAGANAKPDAPEPTDAAGYSRRGEATASRRNYPAALADLDRAVALAPDNPEYVYQRATVRLANGQVFLAMADVEQVLKLRPGDPDALLTRAELRFMGHDRDAGLADLDAIAKSTPTAADVRLRIAGFYEHWDRLPDAIAEYDLWIAAHPDDNRRSIALNGRCWARALLDQDLDKALSDCDAAHRIQPKNSSFLDSRGLVHLRRREFDKAIADYDASLAIQPKSAWSLYGRGLAKLRLGQAGGGKTDLLAAVAVNPAITAQTAKYGLTP